MIRKILLLGILFLTNSDIYAQSAAPTIANGQQAANSLQGSRNYNTDLYTGIVNVNIPIYNYSIDDLDLGVSLGYSMQGIQVDQIASSVGLGWTLNTGGYITRKVVAAEDEIDTPRTGVQGLWVDKRDNNRDMPDEFTAVFGGRTVNFIVDFSGPSSDPLTCCYSCKYAYGTFPKSELIIEARYNDTPFYNFKRCEHRVPYTLGDDPDNRITFRIIDEKGNQFFFDQGDYEIKHPLYYFVTTRWVLTKVITYSGATILYTYRNFADIEYPLYKDQQVRENKDHTGDCGSTFYNGGLKVESDSEIKWDGTFSHIEKIEYPNGVTVNFNFDDDYDRRDLAGTSALDSITVESKYDNAVKNNYTYRFNYAYFSSDPLGGSEEPYASTVTSKYQYRLKLKNITRAGNGHTVAEPYYSFDYNSTKLPPRLSASRDFYGYSNGHAPYLSGTVKNLSSGTITDITSTLTDTMNFLSIPLHSFSFVEPGPSFFPDLEHTYTYGTDRSFDLTHAQACVLNKITNGKGGVTQFYFSGNTLSDIHDLSGVDPSSNTVEYFDSWQFGVYYSWPTDLEGEKQSDGLRIDHITYSDGYNHDNDYTDSYTFSNGIQFFPGGYCWYPTVTSMGCGYPDTGLYDGIVYGKIYTNNYISAMDNIGGANHGYSNVTVTRTGYSGETLSTKKYTFSNLINNAEVDGEPNGKSRVKTNWGIFTHSLPKYYMQKETMGLLLKTEEYNTTGQLLSSITNHYKLSQYQNPSTVWPAYPCANCIEGFGHGKFNYTSPTFEVHPPCSLSGSVSQYYSDHGYYPFSEAVALLTSSSTKIYSGSSYMEIPRTNTYDDNDNLLTTSSIDSKGNTVATINSYHSYAYDISYTEPHSFTQTHYMQFPKEHKEKMEIGSGSWYFTNYLLTSIDGSLSDVKFPAVGIMPADHPLPLVGSLVSKEYAQYDNRNNIVETWYNNHQKCSASIWDNRLGKKIAEVSNARYADIAYTSFEGPFLPNGTQDDNKGNWDFYPANIITADGITGHYYYNISSYSNSVVSSINVLSNGKKYIVSFWYKSHVPKLFLGSTLISVTEQLTVGDWTLCTAIITGNGTDHVLVNSPSSFSFGVTGYIDELRLYPADAGMTTYTHEPLFGVNSVCDARNNIVYTEYDQQGRPYITRDINGNIISLTKHVVQGND